MTKQEFDNAYDEGFKNGYAAGLAEGDNFQAQANLHAEYICPSCKFYETEKCNVCGNDFDLFKFKGKEKDNA